MPFVARLNTTEPSGGGTFTGSDIKIVAKGLDIDPRSRFYNICNMNALDHDRDHREAVMTSSRSYAKKGERIECHVIHYPI